MALHESYIKLHRNILIIGSENVKAKRLFRMKVCVIVLCIGLVTGILSYLFIYDRNKPTVYKPEIDQAVLYSNIAQLASAKPIHTEVQVQQDHFKGIILLQSDNDVTDAAATDLKEKYDNLQSYWQPYHQYYAFEDLDAEVFVAYAEYTPILEAWGYGWYNQNGNLHANYCDHESADDLPNYRNLFRFYVTKGNDEFSFIIYCNTDSADKAFSAAINYYNANF